VQGFARGRLADRRQDALADLLIKLAALGLLRFRRCCHLVVCELDADYRAEGFAQAVLLVEAGGRLQRREVAGARGYLSQSEAVLTFGLGAADKVERVTIHWPGRNAGRPQVLTGLAVDREHRVVQAD
jgi:hypothetical protein